MSLLENYIDTPVDFEDHLLAAYRQEEELVIFDIGACEGEDSIRYSRLFPEATVWAFEPVPENFKKAYFNLVKYRAGNVYIIQQAFSNRVGTAVFHVSSGRPGNADENDAEWDYGNKSSSLLPPSKQLKEQYDWLSFGRTVEVQTETLDSFCREKNIGKIDIAHIDVQGAELMVLKGAGHFLQNIGLIKLEVENVELYEGQPLEQEIESYMKQQGFIKICDTVGAVSGDHVYINKRISRRYARSRLAQRIKKMWGRTTNHVRKSNMSPMAEYRATHFPKKSFSQTGEDLIVDFILKGRGIDVPTYMDIGTFHPWEINNTALFYKSGSRGITIEPNPILFEEISRERPRDINLNIGIGDRTTKLDFYVMSAQSLSTFSKNEAERCVRDHDCSIEKTVKIDIETVNHILSRYFFDMSPDFVSLDTEGLELPILKDIDFDRYRPKVICVETISYSTTGRGEKDWEIIEFLKSKGYLVYADTYINTIFVLGDFWLV